MRRHIERTGNDIKKVYILGYNIYSPGGTSRYILNFRENIRNSGLECIVINYIYNDNIIKDDNVFHYKNFDFSQIDSKDSILIISRESFLEFSTIIRKKNPNLIIVGEIHAPLQFLINTNLYLENIDVIKVNTPEIANTFKEKYNFENIIFNYVALEHMFDEEICLTPSLDKNEPINFYNITRFEEKQKNIRHSLELISALYQRGNNVRFFLNGYGPQADFYIFLIKYYKLENICFINEKLPDDNLVFLSTSFYETFGYSIFEGIVKGIKTITTEGLDGVVGNIYNDIESLLLLDYEIDKNMDKIESFLYSKNDIGKKISDISKLYNEFESSNFSRNYISRLSKSNNTNTKLPTKIQHNYYRETKNMEEQLAIMFPKVASTLRKYPGILYNTRKVVNFIDKKDNVIYTNTNDGYIFIETFHGKCFSGDPKFIAMNYKKRYPNCTIFVSSINSLVDSEIYRCGFEPIRLGSKLYEYIFQVSEIIIINGNLLDKCEPKDNQLVIQTWHGLPIKKMVCDLEDKNQREEELIFLERMKKWTHFVINSDLKFDLLTSAFNLNESNVEIIRDQSPIVSYLQDNQYNEEEITRIYKKYHFNESIDYVLFTPTWRKNSREEVVSLDILEFINQLPKNLELIIKLHPLENHLVSKYRNLDPRIHVFYNEFVDINELLLISKVLITDFSSTIFDFMSLERKIILHIEDYEEYSSSIGLYFDISKELPVGNYTPKELVGEILKTEFYIDNSIYIESPKINLSEKIHYLKNNYMMSSDN